MKLRNVARVAVVPLLATALVTTAGAGTAHAAPKKFIVEVTVSDNGSATASVSDTILPSNRYVIALTSTGGGLCRVTIGDSIDLWLSRVFYDHATGAGNPAVTSTPGNECTMWAASVTYTLSWVGAPGATGQLQVECVWVNRVRTCTPSRFEGDASILPI